MLRTRRKPLFAAVIAMSLLLMIHMLRSRGQQTSETEAQKKQQTGWAASFLHKKVDAQLNQRLDLDSKLHCYNNCTGDRFKIAAATEETSHSALAALLKVGEASLPNGEQRFVEVSALNTPCSDPSVRQCCERVFFMRPGTTDVKVYQQIYIWHYMRYLYTLAEFFKPKYILDAGANVGFSTSIFKVLWPEAIIVSVEPDPSNFAALQRNTAILDGVHVINAGLWGKKARIGQAGQHGEWGKVFKEKRWYQRGGMQAYGVNDLAKMFDIPAFDMVKIDIEGAEGMVFAPDADVSWVKHTTMLSLEVHDYFASYFGLKEVSTRIDAVMRRHPEFTIVSDNEHVMYLSRQVMNELNTRFVG